MKITVIKRNILPIGIITMFFILSACTKFSEKLGWNFQSPGNIPDVEFTDTSTLTAYSQIQDSVKTNNTGIAFLGSYIDPVFGKTTADFYTQLRLTDSLDFGTNPQIDSLVLSLAYQGDIYGEKNTLQTIKVYELQEDMKLDTSYYTHNIVAHNGIELATKTFLPNPTDSIVVGKDTVPAQIRIKLDASLAHKIFNTPEDARAYQDAFLKYFKGLYIKTEPVDVNGSVLYINPISRHSKLNFYYSNESGDSLYSYLTINEFSAYFSHINHHNYANASPEFKAQVLDGDTVLGQDVLYAQALAGIKTKIRFPYIKNLKNIGILAINNAELIINGLEENPEFQIPNQLNLYQITENGTSEIMPDQFSYGNDYFDGVYDTITKQYRFRISAYVQNLLLNEDAIDYGLYLTVGNSSITANRLLINGTNPGTTSLYEKRLKLNITYTIVE